MISSKTYMFWPKYIYEICVFKLKKKKKNLPFNESPFFCVSVQAFFPKFGSNLKRIRSSDGFSC